MKQATTATRARTMDMPREPTEMLRQWEGSLLIDGVVRWVTRCPGSGWGWG
ncbi:hypothetical protein Afil01_53230 [Actinorhabdospora filicis]|uniref:Uncharacterized protein n=1 Tax=Actinorhabdospora filicis TaxID=1785913 RepID=A0A9W6STL2_9ACTN|nr:hypothetical protein Afil01_53230 [Actinorhabdospora filicis]